jgi:hypothetical protein
MPLFYGAAMHGLHGKIIASSNPPQHVRTAASTRRTCVS